MKVIFLDFDGVIIHNVKMKCTNEEGRAFRAADPLCISLLNILIAATGAKVVISSTWRKHHKIEWIRAMLCRSGFKFPEEVISMTPDHTGIEWTSYLRGNEITAWLKLHPEVTNYVVLDDDGDNGPIPREKWVLIEDGWEKGGVQPDHILAALYLLK